MANRRGRFLRFQAFIQSRADEVALFLFRECARPRRHYDSCKEYEGCLDRLIRFVRLGRRDQSEAGILIGSPGIRIGDWRVQKLGF